jgi:hypothetical protein
MLYGNQIMPYAYALRAKETVPAIFLSELQWEKVGKD